MVRTEQEKSWLECCSGEPLQALARLRSLEVLAAVQNDLQLLFRNEWLQAWILFQLGEAEQAFGHIQTARRLSANLDNASKAYALTLGAWILSNLGLSDESYSVARAAVNLAETGEDDFALALADTSGKKIAFSNSYAGNSFRQVMIKSFEQMGAKAKADGKIAGTAVVSANNSVTEQASQIQNLILQGYDTVSG